MATERSKKTINAWAKFLSTDEGQEGLRWLSEQRPITKLSTEVHVFSYSLGQLDWHLRMLDIINDELPTHPPKKEDEPASGLLPTS
jgi:hypothetical protein